MSAKFLQATLLLTMLFATCIGLIHTQPYDDRELRALLAPSDGCPMPCFMGIRPGITSSYEAVAILEAHEWVRNVQAFYDMASEVFLVQWTWSGSQPPLLDGAKLSYLSIHNHVVSVMTVETTIRLGDIWLPLGQPDEERLTKLLGGRASSTAFILDARYLDHSIVVESIRYCPTIMSEIFQSPVTMFFIADAGALYSDDHADLSDWVSSCA